MIHSIKIDASIDERLKEFNAKLPITDCIFQIVQGDGYLFIHTESKSSQRERKNGNLLLDHFEGLRLEKPFKRDV